MWPILHGLKALLLNTNLEFVRPTSMYRAFITRIAGCGFKFGIILTVSLYVLSCWQQVALWSVAAVCKARNEVHEQLVDIKWQCFPPAACRALWRPPTQRLKKSYARVAKGARNAKKYYRGVQHHNVGWSYIIKHGLHLLSCICDSTTPSQRFHPKGITVLHSLAGKPCPL
jgi:hypothetical protein